MNLALQSFTGSASEAFWLLALILFLCPWQQTMLDGSQLSWPSMFMDYDLLLRQQLSLQFCTIRT